MKQNFTEEQIKLINEINDLFSRLDEHPDGLPIQNGIHRLAISPENFYLDADRLCGKAFELQNLFPDKSLFDGAALNSTRNDEVAVVQYCNCKNKKQTEITRSKMKKATEQLKRDLNDIIELINNLDIEN